MVTYAFEALNTAKNVEYIDMPEHLKNKYQYYTCAEMDKMRSIGYTQDVMTLQAAVHDYLVNYCLPGKYLGDE
jgi:ADP-L-glycero-D-manno-heptose 6-epimerase